MSNVPVYLAFEQIGPSHYDAVIQSGTNEELFDNTELLSETSFAETSQGKELTRPVCRCGQGAAKNKMTRKFRLEYKSGCKCYQNLKGCTSDGGCFNCAKLLVFERNLVKTRIRKRNRANNNVVVCLKNGVLKCPEEFLTIAGPDTLETRENKSIEGFLKRL